jgi:hypothetical protein
VVDQKAVAADRVRYSARLGSLLSLGWRLINERIPYDLTEDCKRSVWFGVSIPCFLPAILFQLGELSVPPVLAW